MKWSFDNPAENFLTKNEVLLSKVRACFKNWTIFKKSFFASDWTFGHVEASFDRSNENFLAQGQKLFTQCPKMLKKLTNFSKSDVFSSKRSDGNIEHSFENPFKKSDKRLKKLARSPNMIKRPKFYLKNLFPQNVPIDRQKAVFTALSSFFGEKPKKLLILRNC